MNHILILLVRKTSEARRLRAGEAAAEHLRPTGGDPLQERGKCWLGSRGQMSENYGTIWENDGKKEENIWENMGKYGKSMGQLWENYGKTYGKSMGQV